MTTRVTRVPSVAVEVLRFLVVVFGAAGGYRIAESLVDNPQAVLLGPFNAAWIGVIVGAGLGYSLGGVLARGLLLAIDSGERALEGLSPDQVVAGAIGALVGGALATLVSWPLLLLTEPAMSIPVFLFVVVAGSLFGFRTARRRRGAVLGSVGSRAGIGGIGGQWVARLPRILDTSVAIDGRLLDVVRSGFQGGTLLVPQPVLAELQGMADSGDDMRRARGRRGLDVLEQLRREQTVELEVIPDGAADVEEVDAKLVAMCLDRPAALLTFDTNLARVANLAGVRVLNMHALALALRPPVAVGDRLDVHLVKAGKEPGQAVAYLDDGTMVVVESARDEIGREVSVTISSVLTTANGRLVFARMGGQEREARRRSRPAPSGGRPTPADLRLGRSG